MAVNDRKSYLSYLNKLVDQYNNTYHYFIGEKLINANYSTLTEKVETNPKAPKLMTELKLVSRRIFLVKVTLKIGHELMILFRKLILRHIKLKI